MTKLRISADLALPLEAVTQSMAILARRGAGKTYTGSVLSEEVIRAKVPVVILDPTGAWWGLRSSADGTKEGLPVTIFGGDHGDMTLEPTAGALFADVVLEHPGAYIFDLSAFTSKADEQRFAAAFLEHLYRGKKPDSGPLFLIVDEADVFAPQQPREKGDQLRTLGALESIVRRGRIKGIGVLLITQRAAVLNKNVLTQTEVLVVMQTTGPQDQAAIKEWVKGNSTDDELETVMSSMASMHQGDAWVWSPAFLRILKRIHVRARTTFDSSRTPGAGETRVEPKTFAQVDLEALGERIAATKEQQQANEPKALKRRIAELEREIATRPTETVDKVVEKIIEVPALTEEQLHRLEESWVHLTSLAATIDEAADNVAVELRRWRSPETPTHAPRQPAAAQPIQKARPAPRRITRQASSSLSENPSGDVRLGIGERKVLEVLAEYPDGRTYNELAFLAGYSAKASTLGVILSKLRKAELVEQGNQPVRATPAGLAEVGGARERPTGQALLDQWLRHPRMGEGERRVLLALLEAYPDELSHQDLCERTGYSPDASTIGVILSKLRKLGLVDKGRRRVADEFNEAVAGHTWPS